jgi:hypothetical protein
VGCRRRRGGEGEAAGAGTGRGRAEQGLTRDPGPRLHHRVEEGGRARRLPPAGALHAHRGRGSGRTRVRRGRRQRLHGRQGSAGRGRFPRHDPRQPGADGPARQRCRTRSPTLPPARGRDGPSSGLRRPGGGDASGGNTPATRRRSRYGQRDRGIRPGQAPQCHALRRADSDRPAAPRSATRAPGSDVLAEDVLVPDPDLALVARRCGAAAWRRGTPGMRPDTASRIPGSGALAREGSPFTSLPWRDRFPRCAPTRITGLAAQPCPPVRWQHGGGGSSQAPRS